MADQPKDAPWIEVYEERKDLYAQLASEGESTLNSAIRKKKMKAHSVISRVKSAESIAKKAKDKELEDPLRQLDDVVGVRAVVLFLSALPRLDKLIHDSFSVISSENKITD